jgi:hypothetical protein
MVYLVLTGEEAERRCWINGDYARAEMYRQCVFPREIIRGWF